MSGGATRTRATLDGVPVIRLENGLLRVDVAPSVGGRIVGLRHLPSGYEYLWRHPTLPLRRALPDTEYDPQFYGGIDEQIPCDAPESIDGIAFPDHGELWTLPLGCSANGDGLVLSGTLPLMGLFYERSMTLVPEVPELRLRYRLENRSGSTRSFLWKLHVALAVVPEDRIECSAERARPLAPEWAPDRSLAPFAWPWCRGQDLSVTPPAVGGEQFLSLTGLADGRVGWCRPSTGRWLRIGFDLTVFPCCWLFASYGRIPGLYTAILEPSTSSLRTVFESRAQGVGLRLPSGASLETEVVVSVG